MTESELNAKYTVAFVNSLYIDEGNLWVEVESVVDGELIGKKL